MSVFIAIILYIIDGCVWGVITENIANNKGYDGWFGWGFFFGILAIAILLAKPDKTYGNRDYIREEAMSNVSKQYTDEKLLKENGWKCIKCNVINPSYTGTCGCGNTRVNNEEELKKRVLNIVEARKQINSKEDNNVATEEKSVNKEQKIIDIIKQYKQLYETGAITVVEYERKKSELLKK